ncbi:MAG: CvpA family protein [Thermodesulfobacteriota bacterium]|nr:CvpA family protein [Thermodesulfobacteriota bacterium]
MNALDVVICLIGGFCLIRGIFRGSIREITSIVGVFVGFYGAYTYYPLLASWLSEFIVNQPYLNIISFLLAFIIVFLAVGLVGVILKQLLKGAKLGWSDRILGAVLGSVKAALVVSVLLIPIMTFLPKNHSLIRDSILAPYVTIVSENIVAFVPRAMKERFRENVKILKSSWKEI